MANAYPVDITFSPTAAGLAADQSATAGTTAWTPSIGAKDYALHLHASSGGQGTVILEGCNILGATVVPTTILTATAAADGDFYDETTTPYAYKYVRLRCSAFTADDLRATVVGVRG